VAYLLKKNPPASTGVKRSNGAEITAEESEANIPGKISKRESRNYRIKTGEPPDCIGQEQRGSISENTGVIRRKRKTEGLLRGPADFPICTGRKESEDVSKIEEGGKREEITS